VSSTKRRIRTLDFNIKLAASICRSHGVKQTPGPFATASNSLQSDQPQAQSAVAGLTVALRRLHDG